MDSTSLSKSIRTTFQVTFVLGLFSHSIKLFDNNKTIQQSPTWRHSLHLLAEADIELADRDQGLALQLGLSEQFVDWNIICGVGIDLLPHLVSTIQAVVATLTIALVWTLVRISWPWHLTQVRVVARRQPDHRHWFGVNSKESRSLYSPLFSNLSPGTCVRYPLLSRTTPQIPPPTFRIQESNFEL